MPLDLNQPWLSHQHLQTLTEVIKEMGAALQNCWAFIDGTVRPISRPGRNQRVMYNVMRKCIQLNFNLSLHQTVLLLTLMALWKEKRTTAQCLWCVEPASTFFVQPSRRHLMYPAYPLRLQLQCPFRGARLTETFKRLGTSQCVK